MLSGRFHLQRIVEAVEIIEQSDGRQQFDHFTFIIVPAQTGPERVINLVSVSGHTLGETQRSFFFISEIRAAFKVVQIFDLIF